MKTKLCMFVLALAVGMTLRVPARAQADLFSLEAAFIFNFTAFTDWPAQRGRMSTLVVCAHPHGGLNLALSKLEGRATTSRTWHIQPLVDNADLSACDVLIVDGNTADASAVKSALASDRPLLVVRTADAPEGPYVILLVREGDRLRFDVDNREVARRHLGLSSKLLRLARKVI